MIAETCRCAYCDGARMDAANRIGRLKDVADYARATVAAQSLQDAAIAQKDYAVEVARQPTHCAGINCRGVSKCFGCPVRKVETTFLPRSAW